MFLKYGLYPVSRNGLSLFSFPGIKCEKTHVEQQVCSLFNAYVGFFLFLFHERVTLKGHYFNKGTYILCLILYLTHFSGLTCF